MLDDKFTDLEKITKERIEEIKLANHDKLLAICDSEGFDVEDMTDDEIREALIKYYEDEIND